MSGVVAALGLGLSILGLGIYAARLLRKIYRAAREDAPRPRGWVAFLPNSRHRFRDEVSVTHLDHAGSIHVGLRRERPLTPPPP